MNRCWISSNAFLSSTEINASFLFCSLLLQQELLWSTSDEPQHFSVFKHISHYQYLQSFSWRLWWKVQRLFCFCTKQASRAWKWTPLPSFSTRESHTQLIAGRSAIYSSFSFAWGQLWGAFYTSSFISPLDWTLVPTVVADLMIQPAFPSLSYLLLF